MEYKYQSEQGHAELVDQTTRRVKPGLKLNEGLPDISDETEDRIARTIAETVIETAEVLAVNRPEIGLLYRWGDTEKSKKYEKTDAAVFRFEDPKKILYSPAYLETIGQEIEHPRTVKESSTERVRLLTAHEMYHFRAGERFPQPEAREVRKYSKKKGEEQKAAWLGSRVEYAAELFALFYLSNRKTKGWKESLGKFLATTEKWRKVYGMKKYRRKMAVK